MERAEVEVLEGVLLLRGEGGGGGRGRELGPQRREVAVEVTHVQRCLYHREEGRRQLLQQQRIPVQSLSTRTDQSHFKIIST